MATPRSQLSFSPDEWPDGLTYLEDYIQEDEAERLVREVDAAPWRTELKSGCIITAIVTTIKRGWPGGANILGHSLTCFCIWRNG